MEQHNHQTTHQCTACGATRVESDMRAVGFDEHRGPVTWACVECVPPTRKVLRSQPEKVRIPNGKPALSFKTVAAAEQLAREGYGWTADHVMRKGLELLILESKLRAARAN